MLFNSYPFIFLFFPIVLAGYFLLGRTRFNKLANLWLVLASLAFYGYWDISFLPLLLGSILVNYTLSGGILRGKRLNRLLQQKIFFGLGLFFNLGLLGIYKYLDFFLENINLLGANVPLLHLILPLGISFFTITQILYLLDCYAGVAKDHDFINYALFVSFFPHLLAGPILYHKPMMEQFSNSELRHLNWDNMASGLSLFIIGLTKKVVIADSLISFIAQGFSHPENLTMVTAWFTAVSYMMQLYFDFSGYSDMAVGLAKMLNIDIPMNFNAPYRAKSLIAFWQRWHISLTNAITACVYMPVLRSFKQMSWGAMVFSSFVAFFVVGIWHGAGWKYVAFALLHSGGIVVNHIWRHYHLWMPVRLGQAITLLVVLISHVIFRADDMHNAGQMLLAMTGAHGFYSGLQFPRMLIIAVLLAAFAPTSLALSKRNPSYATAIILAAALTYSVSRLSSITEFLYFQF